MHLCRKNTKTLISPRQSHFFYLYQLGSKNNNLRHYMQKQTRAFNEIHQLPTKKDYRIATALFKNSLQTKFTIYN